MKYSYFDNGKLSDFQINKDYAATMVGGVFFFLISTRY